MKLTCWQVIDAIVGKTRRLLLYGPPGTGKTYAAHHHSAPPAGVYTLTLTDETPASELRGFYVPRANEFVWQDGPAILAWRRGARLVLNEIDKASSDTLSLLLNILDDPDHARMTLPSGETISPADTFEVIATSNEPPDALPVALQDRFAASILVDQVAPAALENLPDDLKVPAARSAVHPDPKQRIGLRAFAEFARLRALLGDTRGGADIAGTAVFGDRAKDVLAGLKVAAIKE